jgi:hypothetical protein
MIRPKIIGEVLEKPLNLIKISAFKKITKEYNTGYFAVHSPQTTILILDKNRKHTGSIYLPEFRE